MKNKVTRYLLACAMLSASATAAMAATDAKLTVTLDSAHVEMGRTTPMHVNLVGTADPDGRLLIPKDTLNSKVEILRILEADTSDLGNNRREINLDILLQSFDSGDYRLNPIVYVSGKDTVLSNRLALRVLPVMVDTLEINDFAGVSDVDREWMDYLPDFLVDYGIWILALILVLLGGGALAYYLMKNRRKEETAAPVILLSPYEQAVTDLEILRSKNLCEKGQEKEYYSRLTEILRVYLQRRFGINAMEMTSSEILDALQRNEETRMPRRYMNQILEVADFVKFAKVRPLPEDNKRSYDSALKFVEDTREIPQEPEAEKTGETGETNTPTTKSAN